MKTAMEVPVEQLITRAWQVRQANFPSAVTFNFPLKTRALTVTGSQCQLNCAHCNGHYLKKMLSVTDWRAKLTPDITSCLISGGCTRDGKVPVLRHLPVIQEIKQSGRRINLHAGLLDEAEIEQLDQVADVVSFDFVGDRETIQEVYGLDKTVDDYIKVYLSLRKKVKVVPHICIGLRGANISGEYKALQLLQELGADGLVFIVFMPTPGTKYANRTPPVMDEVVRILARARIALPTTPLHLGCMRPPGNYRAELDRLALRCGVNKIVQPTPGAVSLAGELGLKIKRGEECCAL